MHVRLFRVLGFLLAAALVVGLWSGCSSAYEKCEVHTDCPGSQECVFRGIVGTCLKGCADQKECDDSEFCRNLGASRNDYCRPKCDSDDDCPSDMKCLSIGGSQKLCER